MSDPISPEALATENEQLRCYLAAIREVLSASAQATITASDLATDAAVADTAWLLLVYPTHNDSEKPVLVSLDRNFTNVQFVVFLDSLTGALGRPQGGYDHVRMTICLMERDSAGWVEKANFQV